MFVGTVEIAAPEVRGSITARCCGVSRADALLGAAILAQSAGADSEGVERVRYLSWAARQGAASLNDIVGPSRSGWRMAHALERENAELAGWGDAFKAIANAGWELAKKHRAKIAAAAATAVLGPAGGLLVAKAFDVLDKAKKGNPEAVRALKSIVVAARAGNPKAIEVMKVVTMEAAAERREEGKPPAPLFHPPERLRATPVQPEDVDDEDEDFQLEGPSAMFSMMRGRKKGKRRRKGVARARALEPDPGPEVEPEPEPEYEPGPDPYDDDDWGGES